MRFLHTSDWHLGRSFHRVNLLDAQREFLDHLIATAGSERVDAVLVAGDVYDRAVPPLAAVELFDQTLHRLAELGVPTVMISGNHDSARRLGVGAGLMGRAGIHLRTDPATCHRPVVLADEHGDVAVYGLPYLEPALAREAFGADEFADDEPAGDEPAGDEPAAGERAPDASAAHGAGGEDTAGAAAADSPPARARDGRPRADHAYVLGAAMDRVRADLASRPAGTRSVVLAHAFVTGGTPSDSERDITVGGVASVPAALFDGVDYVALGHLHGCQTISDRVRYSGSPLAYSFSEEHHRKSMWLVTLGADGGVSAERLDTPVPRPLARLRGTLDDLLGDPALDRHTGSWIEATLTDPFRPYEPMAALAKRFPHILSLAFDPEDAGAGRTATYAQRLRGRGDREIAEDFVAHVRGSAADDRERAVLQRAFDAVRGEAARTEAR
jgi:exonuclease SbcD